MTALALDRSDALSAPAARVTAKHHVLVRLSHWINVFLLIGLTLSGLSIYWASPVFQHAPSPVTGNQDFIADAGVWIVRHVPGFHGYGSAPTWVYDHFSLGTGMLAAGLQLHWLFAYLFMLNGLIYLVGLILGRGYRALIPRAVDPAGAVQMIRYYIGWAPARLLKRPWPHPVASGKYNALQKTAYASMPVAGVLTVMTGWAIHKPSELGWLAALFGGYDSARVWHFFLMLYFAAFVIPHVALVIADGWDTFRSMVVGWTERGDGSHGS